MNENSADNFLKATMDPDEKQELLMLLDSGRDDFLNAVANVTDDLAGRSPGGGKWSVLQCVEHVAVAEEYLLSQVLAATHSDTAVLNRVREAVIKRKGADRTRPAESPEVARPKGRFHSVTEAVSYFLASRKRTIEFVKNCDGNLRAMLTEHPVIGPANCHEMLLLLAVHPRRHAAQIDEIRNSLSR